MAILLDIETVSLPLADLEAVMPDHIRNPQMPEELTAPGEIDGSKCPAYGGNKDKQAAWMQKQIAAKADSAKKALEAWKAKSDAARLKFITDAALDARTATVKLIGLRDTLTGETIIYAFEEDELKQDALLKIHDVAVYRKEGGMLTAFFRDFVARIEEGKADNENILVGYYIKEFDLPFLHKRAWANRIPQRPIYRKGRYWSSEIVDLYEEWGFGERYVASGGLDGLARFLGVPTKTGTGFAFGELYAKDPAEGVAYLVNDLEVLEGCSRAMGVIL